MQWSHKQDAVIRQVVNEASILIPWSEIAQIVSERLGGTYTEDQIRNRAKRIGAERPLPGVPVFESSYPPPFEMLNQEHKKILESDAKRVVSAKVREEARFEFLLETIEDVVPRLKVPARPNFKVSNPGHQEMVVVISDSHFGQLVEPDVVGDGWEYNESEFWARKLGLEGRVQRIFDIQEKVDHIDKVHVFFLGDIVDGVDMRRGQSHRNDVNSAVKQAFGAARAFADTLSYWSELMPQIEVHAAYGNHGRVGEFGVNLPMDNWDYVAYYAMQAHLKDHPNITFTIPDQKYGIENILGTNIYYAHGDAIGGKGATSRSIKQYVASLQNLHHQVFDLALFGHFHTGESYAAGNTRIFMNGAWPGGDDYSINQLGLATPPRQWVFGLSPTRGVTWEYQIDLTNKRLPTPATGEPTWA